MQKHTLHNASRERLIIRNNAETALVLDALYTLNCTTGKAYTVASILEMTRDWGISERVIRTGLKSWVFFRQLVRTAGRPAIAYVLPTPYQVRRHLEIYDHTETADKLPVGAFKSVSAYKRFLHGAMVVRLTQMNSGRFKMQRAKMAERLNVTVDTIRNYERTFEIEVLPYITSVQVRNSWDLSEIPPVNNHDHRYFLQIVKPDGSTRRYPNVRGIAQHALALKCTVYRCKQNSNLYMYTGDMNMWGWENIPLPQPPPKLGITFRIGQSIVQARYMHNASKNPISTG